MKPRFTAQLTLRITLFGTAVALLPATTAAEPPSPFADSLGTKAVPVYTTATGQPEGPQDLVFGKSYVRVYVTHAYIPKGKQNSFTVTVTTHNRTPLTFKYAYEPQPDQVFSSRGEYLVVPFIALNTKSQIEIETAVRSVKDQRNSFGLVQGVLTAAAGVFTGGALSTVSMLQRYATTASNVVGEHEKRSVQVDVNREILFDPQDAPFIRFRPTRLSLFTRGKGNFPAYEDYNNKPGKTIVIKESGVQQIGFADELREAKAPTQLKFIVKKDDTSRTTVYPTGKNAFIIIRIEAYQPYGELAANPEQVTAVKPHFAALKTAYEAFPRLDDDVSSQKRQTLLDGEGRALRSTLDILTGAGDVSTADARIIMEAFIERCTLFGGRPTGFKAEYLISLADWFRAP